MSFAHPSPEAEMLAVKVASNAERVGLGGAAISGVSQFFGLTPDQWAVVGVIGGLAIGFFGMVAKLALDWYFQNQHLKIERHKAGMPTRPGGLA